MQDLQYLRCEYVIVNRGDRLPNAEFVLRRACPELTGIRP